MTGRFFNNGFVDVQMTPMEQGMVSITINQTNKPLVIFTLTNKETTDLAINLLQAAVEARKMERGQ